MYDLPEPPAATTGQADNPLTDAVIRAAVDNAIHEARRTSTSPRAVIGSSPPVEQHGRPAMSPRATDVSVVMIAAGAASLMVSGGVSLVLWSSGHADPTVIAWMAAGPPMAFLSLKALVKGVKRAATLEIHHHNGPEYHEHRTTSSRSIWNKNVAG